MAKKKTRLEVVIERWENAVRVLQALTPHERRKHFDMSQWGEKTDCGTIGCAAGHCGLDPWFRKRGFKLHFDKGSYAGEMSIDPMEFFDPEGVENIFHNSDQRSVGTVLKEIRAHIKNLKAGLVDVESGWF